MRCGMGFVWPEQPDGPRTTPRASAALVALGDGLVDARHALTGAGQVRWVSAAATSYQTLLADALADVARLSAAHQAAWATVLRHTRAADDAHEVVERQARAGLFQLPEWRP
jgi:hypothetical protein